MNVLKINNRLQRDCCPLCGAADIGQIGKLKYGGGAQFSSVEIDLDCTPELWKCRRCDSAFVQNSVDADMARTLYSMGKAGERWLSRAFDEEKTSGVVHVMAEIFKTGGSVLDVGCNTGELLDFSLGFGCETSGVEFSSASREVIHRKGHRAYSALEDTPGGYDIITAFDIVEHLYDIPAFMESCMKKLAQKGRLIVMTGNVDCLSAKLTGARWWYAQFPEHIVFPSKRYFSNYVDLKIEKWIPSYASKYFECSIYSAYKEMLNSLLRGFAYTGLPSPVPDHALIIFRK